MQHGTDIQTTVTSTAAHNQSRPRLRMSCGRLKRTSCWQRSTPRLTSCTACVDGFPSAGQPGTPQVSSFCGFFILLFSQQSFPLFSQVIGNRRAKLSHSLSPLFQLLSFPLPVVAPSSMYSCWFPPMTIHLPHKASTQEMVASRQR